MYLERPDKLTDVAAIDAEREVIRRLSWIGNAALSRPVGCVEGIAGAWAVLKAAVRASRDISGPCSTTWCRTTAIIG